MNSTDILQIAQQLRASGMQAIDIRDAQTRLRLVVGQGHAAPAAVNGVDAVEASTSTDDAIVVRSNALGVVRLRHPAQAGGVALSVGAKVEAGASAIYLESRGILKSIESPQAGEVVQLLVGDGDKVDFGKPVFTIKARP